jgi:hypothetical protein
MGFKTSDGYFTRYHQHLFFDEMSNQVDIVTQLQQKVPFISNHVKNLINEIYRNQMEILNDEKHHHQRQKFIQLFNELLRSLDVRGDSLS